MNLLRFIVSLFCLFSFPVFFLTAAKKGFSWDEQNWKSEQEKIFWLAIPDWGELKEDFYLYPYDKDGDVISDKNKLGFSGFARAYIHQDGMGYFRVVLEVDKGWVELKKVWDMENRKRILRSYNRGVLTGRYIDWHENGQRKIDGHAKNGKKDGVWKEWYSNGQKREEGKWLEGKAHGIFEEWYSTGKKANEQVFYAGILKTALVWKPDGTLCRKSRVEQGEGILLEYNQYGNLIGESEIKSGKRFLPKGE